MRQKYKIGDKVIFKEYADTVDKNIGNLIIGTIIKTHLFSCDIAYKSEYFPELLPSKWCKVSNSDIIGLYSNCEGLLTDGKR